MKLTFLLFFVLLLRPWPLADGTSDVFAVWNVGQGSWATVLSSSQCLHFDMGGERHRWPKKVNRCLRASNYLYISHLDLDHIFYVRTMQKRSRHLCLTTPPRDSQIPRTSQWKKSIVASLPACEQKPKIVREIQFEGSFKDPNSLSRVFQTRDFLVPGDSSTSAEKVWASKVKGDPKVLLLGHHGSRTSTSHLLLHHLPQLKTAVASARKKKYGHPHREIEKRMAQTKTPLLTTEKWGHLLFEIKN